ncbi:MFS transporter [Caldiplasma sukawensis]
MDRRVLYLSITRFIRVVGRVSTFVFLPIIFVFDYKLSLFETGIITAAATAVMSVIQYFSGPWSDRFGRKFFLEVVPYFASISYFLLFWAVGYGKSLLLMIVFWLTSMFISALQYPAIQSSVADLTDSSQRLQAYTYVRVFANAGAAAGPVIGAFLSVFGFQWIFFLAGATLIVEAIMMHLLVGETYSGKKFTRKEYRKIKKTGLIEKSGYFKNPFMVAFTLAGILFGFDLRQTGPAFTLYLFHLQNTSVISLGFIYGLNGLLVVLLQIPVFRIMSKRGNVMHWRAFGTFVYALAFLLLTAFTGFFSFLIIMGIFTLGEDFASPTTQTILMEISPQDSRGDYVGKYSFITSSGRVAGTVVGLGLLQFFQSQASIFWYIISASTFICTVWFFLMIPSFIKNSTKISEPSI